jgi:hypothetical protein
MLNGFEYNLLTGDSSTAWRVCKRWIEKQIPEYLNTEFKPQPYVQISLQCSGAWAMRGMHG